MSPPTAATDPTALPDAAGLRPIRFVHRGRVVSIAPGAAGIATTTTVLQWLREDQRLTGTKEGCNEGDCGACTVLVGRLPRPDEPAPAHPAQALVLEPVNACIRLLPTLDGLALLTVDDLRGHPAQTALVACHGSQCGFCTPGFVMTMAALQQGCAAPGVAPGAATVAATGKACATAAAPPARRDIADALSGNLCRCTGYRPILDAAEAMLQAAPAPAIDTEPLAALLRPLQADAPLQWADAAGARFQAPRAAAGPGGLAEARAQRPEARLLAGCTDIGLWVNKQHRALPDLIYLGRVDALQAIGEVVDADGLRWLRIPAATSLEAAWSALAQRWPPLREMGLRFASPPVRHAGTFVGNLANGSPIGDGAPVALALGARLQLRRGEALRTVALDDFYLGYQRNALQPGEWITAVDLPLDGPEPLPAGGTAHLRAYKLSKRHDSDISGVACGLWLALDAAGRVSAARLAFGGMAATTARARQAEAALIGRSWADPATPAAAAAALARDFQPIDDLRASAAYRRQGAAALLQRLWWQTRPDAPLAAEASSVWA